MLEALKGIYESSAFSYIIDGFMDGGWKYLVMYAFYPVKVNKQDVLDTFFMNTMYKSHKLYKGEKGTSFLVDDNLHFRICSEECTFKNNPNVYYALHKLEQGQGNLIPLWLFGFLY